MLAKYEKAFNLADQLAHLKKNAGTPDLVVSNGYTITFAKSHLMTEDGSSLFYTPSPTGVKFHKDNSYFRLLKGPFGSGKTTICLEDMFIKTIEYTPCTDGVRRTKWLVIRNTYDMLDTSTVPSFYDWFVGLGDDHSTKKPPRFSSTFLAKHEDTNEIIKCEIHIVFMALDDEKDVRKLKSVNCTGVYLNELSEFPRVIYSIVKGRIGRYPEKKICPNRKGKWIIADTNPPSTKSWIYETFEVRQTKETDDFGRVTIKKTPKDWVMYSQPPGLIRTDEGGWRENPDRENAQFLDPDYYERMAENESEEFVNVFCLGNWGSFLSGKRIYPRYNDDFHSSSKVKYVEGLAIIPGFDFGNTPSCILSQYNPIGKLEAFKEFVSENMNIRELCENQVLPWLRLNCPDYQILLSWIDPAGVAKPSSEGASCYSILSELGFNPQVAPSNNPIVRWDGVKELLNKNVGGMPALEISREGCPILREGFQGGYQYRMIRSKDGISYSKDAKKDHYSHPHDGLQYIALGLSGYNPTKETESEIIYYDEY